MITPYKQTLSHSCLAACFLMLSKRRFTKSDEQKLTVEGSQRKHKFYVAGIPLEFVKEYNRKIVVYVDNTYFARILEEIFLSEKRIGVIQKKISQSLIKNLLRERSLICHIDYHDLGDYSHASHFIILEKATKQFVEIIDPWTGKRRKLSFSKLDKGIYDLKTQIKMCPLLFTVG